MKRNKFPFYRFGARSPFLGFYRIILILPLLSSLVGIRTQAEGRAVPFTAELAQTWDAVSLPVQLAPLFSGTVEGWESQNTIRITSPALPKTISPDLLLSREDGPAYLEVVGPRNHPWLGHRLEVATGTTTSRSAQILRIRSSSRNTRGFPDNALAGAEICAYPHITLPFLLKHDVEWLLRQKPQPILRFFLPFSFGFNEVRPCLSAPAGKLSWGVLTEDLTWVPESLDNLAVAPGSSFVMQNSKRRGAGFSLLGLQRINLPCPRPWQGKGPHLLGYPFSANLHLGTNWPPRGGPLQPSEKASDCDYLGLYLPEGYRTFGYFGTNESTASWRELIRPDTRRAAWGAASNTLTIIPAGQGFLLYPRKDGPDHRFDPPSSPN